MSKYIPQVFGEFDEELCVLPDVGPTQTRVATQNNCKQCIE